MVLIGAVLTALFLVSATVAWTQSRGDSGGTSGAVTAEQSQPDDAEGSAGDDSDAASSDGTQDGSGQAVDGSMSGDGEDASDPLGLGYELVNQPCNGGFLVVMASSGDPTAYRGTLLPVLQEFETSDGPGSYLRTDESCETFNQAGADGSPIYAAYLGPYDDGRTACQERMDATSTSTYVKQLDGASKGPFYCVCAYDLEDLPDLNTDTDAESSGDRRFWMVELQHILYNTGFNPGQFFGGNFGSKTVGMVRSFQMDRGVEPSGSLDTETWQAMQESTCS